MHGRNAALYSVPVDLGDIWGGAGPLPQLSPRLCVANGTADNAAARPGIPDSLRTLYASVRIQHGELVRVVRFRRNCRLILFDAALLKHR